MPVYTLKLHERTTSGCGCSASVKRPEICFLLLLEYCNLPLSQRLQSGKRHRYACDLWAAVNIHIHPADLAAVSRSPTGTHDLHTVRCQMSRLTCTPRLVGRSVAPKVKSDASGSSAAAFTPCSSTSRFVNSLQADNGDLWHLPGEH